MFNFNLLTICGQHIRDSVVVNTSAWHPGDLILEMYCSSAAKWCRLITIAIIIIMNLFLPAEFVASIILVPRDWGGLGLLICK